MKELLNYYLRRHYILLLLLFISSVVQRFGLIDTDGWIILLSWILAYRWGLEERNNRSWMFFQSLPISFRDKIVTKVALPFGLFLLAFIINGPLWEGYRIPTHVFTDMLAMAAVIVAVTLSAPNLVLFVLLAVVSTAFTSNIDTPAFGVGLAILALAQAVVSLSDKRLEWGKHMLVGLVMAIVLAGIHGRIVKSLIYNMLDSDVVTERITGAELVLGDEHEDSKARAVVVDLLKDELSPRILKKTIRLVDRYNIDYELPIESIRLYIERDSESREVILSYFQGRSDEWRRVEQAGLVQEIENIVLRGGKKCDDDCEIFTNLVASNYLADPKNKEKLISFLNSNNWQKINFALNIIESQVSLILEDELRALEKRTKDKELRIRIKILLDDWQSDEIGRELGEQIGRIIDRELNDATDAKERRKIRKIIKKSLKDIE